MSGKNFPIESLKPAKEYSIPLVTRLTPGDSEATSAS